MLIYNITPGHSGKLSQQWRQSPGNHKKRSSPGVSWTGTSQCVSVVGIGAWNLAQAVWQQVRRQMEKMKELLYILLQCSGLVYTEKGSLILQSWVDLHDCVYWPCCLSASPSWRTPSASSRTFRCSGCRDVRASSSPCSAHLLCPPGSILSSSTCSDASPWGPFPEKSSTFAQNSILSR